jgi:hypothetical protein
MYEPLLDYARQNNQELIRRLALEKQLRNLRSKNTNRRSNLRLTLSKILFTLGNKIRPQEFEVYNECKVNRCNLYADIT